MNFNRMKLCGKFGGASVQPSNAGVSGLLSNKNVHYERVEMQQNPQGGKKESERSRE